MNALNRASLKVVVCGAAALALTLASSWSFVQSTSVVRVSTSSAYLVANAASDVGTRLAQTAATGLLQ
ncbi:MAG: hypothetical protein ABI885_28470 [Gammaproteobacteria bacterium]